MWAQFWIDARIRANVKIYIDGVRVNSGTTFTLAGASGPLYLIAHLEKTSDDSPGEYHVDRLVGRYVQAL